jgi:1-deoxy-D-xylulose-5-phosphate reductoisomerase
VSNLTDQRKSPSPQRRPPQRRDPQRRHPEAPPKIFSGLEASGPKDPLPLGENSRFAAALKPCPSENTTAAGSSPQQKSIAILGSTGSIGTSTLSIVQSFPDRYRVTALAAGRNVLRAFEQCVDFHPRIVSVATEEDAETLLRVLNDADIDDIEVVHGTEGTVRVATLPEVDFVVSAIVGVAGLEATYQAIRAGKTIGLANKECLVAAGEILVPEAQRRGVALLPIDSEHNAIHQCLRAGQSREVKQLWLTASGGPFRETTLADFDAITPAQALKHPTWVMGQRITIDSATMMNKGFEVIEACRLFNLPASQVKTILHPQSAVHSFVEFVDGSLLAQISVTDMRLPILYALAYPERVPSDLTFDMTQLRQLDFAMPDFARYPCLRVAYEAAEAGGSACIALNAADEVAVAAFLAGEISFPAISRTIEQTLQAMSVTHPADIAQVFEADAEARTIARRVAQKAAV